MTATYHIRGWSDNYESYESSRLKKALAWVAMPTKHDGKGLRRVMRMDPSGALYGAWCLIVQVAAKCPTRGTLADQDGPLTALDISDKTGLSEEAAARALEVFASAEIRWLEIAPEDKSAGTPAGDAGTPEQSAGVLRLQDTTLHDHTGPNSNKTETDTTPPDCETKSQGRGRLPRYRPQGRGGARKFRRAAKGCDAQG